MSLTTDVLHELFEYKEGKLYRKTKQGNAFGAGTVCGYKTEKGYLRTEINNKSYYVHRIIYQMFYGHVPRNLQIDHKNGKKEDNRIDNLRVVTNDENQWNKHYHKGYCKRENGTFRVEIRVNNKRLSIGCFKTEEEAASAYKEAKEKYHIIKDRRHEHTEI